MSGDLGGQPSAGDCVNPTSGQTAANPHRQERGHGADLPEGVRGSVSYSVDVPQGAHT